MRVSRLLFAIVLGWSAATPTPAADPKDPTLTATLELVQANPGDTISTYCWRVSYDRPLCMTQGFFESQIKKGKDTVIGRWGESVEHHRAGSLLIKIAIGRGGQLTFSREEISSQTTAQESLKISSKDKTARPWHKNWTLQEKPLRSPLTIKPACPQTLWEGSVRQADRDTEVIKKYRLVVGIAGAGQSEAAFQTLDDTPPLLVGKLLKESPAGAEPAGRREHGE